MAGINVLVSAARRVPRMRVRLGIALACVLPALAGCGSYYPQTGLSGPYARAVQRPYVDRFYVYAPRRERVEPVSTDSATPPTGSSNGVPMRQESGTTGTGAPGGRNRPTPVVGSPEWQNEQQASTRDQEQLNRTLGTICRGC
jgi:hypothetical protein